MLRGPLHADVDRVVALHRAAAEGRGPRWPASEIAGALIEFIAALPVYRTYVAAGWPARRGGPGDHRAGGTRAPRRRARTLTSSRWIGELMLGRTAHGDVDAAARLQFVQRVQQLSGPATAKGVEDTALYDYVPLASRNEVGGAPDRPLDERGATPPRRQRAARRRPSAGARWRRTPTTPSAAPTPERDSMRYRRCRRSGNRRLRRWRKLNDAHRRRDNAEGAPDANTEYLLYQTLVALWPSPPDLCANASTKYMLKAAREAKVHTNWVTPSQSYEQALEQFVGRILAPCNERVSRRPRRGRRAGGARRARATPCRALPCISRRRERPTSIKATSSGTLPSWIRTTAGRWTTIGAPRSSAIWRRPAIRSAGSSTLGSAGIGAKLLVTQSSADLAARASRSCSPAAATGRCRCADRAPLTSSRSRAASTAGTR